MPDPLPARLRFTAAEMLDLARLFQDLARSPGLLGMEDQVALVLSRDDLTRLAALLIGERESVSAARAEALREGMSPRDYLAAAAVQGWVAHFLPINDATKREVAEHCYAIADAMLVARQKEPGA